MTERLRIAGLRSPLAGPFDLSAESGACIAITGASGAGKSLFLRLVADLDPGEGEIWLDGRARSTMPAQHWRRQVVYCGADSGWWQDQVADHFTTSALAGIRTLADRLGLTDELIDGPVARLSTGERQRMALVRAVALDPPVLLLDEPTGPLDQDSAARVEALLRELVQRGTTMLMVTHDPAQAARLGGRHFVMANRVLEAA